jgi:hypothetical protein
MITLYILLLHLIIVSGLWGLSIVYNKNHPDFVHHEYGYKYYTPIEKIFIPYNIIGSIIIIIYLFLNLLKNCPHCK